MKKTNMTLSLVSKKKNIENRGGGRKCFKRNHQKIDFNYFKMVS